MNTEQQLIERAEAIFTFDDYAHNPECNYHHIISKMLDFHKQELQRIGEVYQAVSVEDELPDFGWYNCTFGTEYIFRAYYDNNGQWLNDNVKANYSDRIIPVTHWLKKLSLLEVKDVTSVRQDSIGCCDAPFKDTNSI